ncbi:hypothetical protein BROUX41_000399 [Berkeleyomyces rouxiae]|uniref:uncharacterized protein n=1 Tax=Berkeleyomyces rouxiae TaxID=2035830 RepID=UPI003B76DDDE
MASFPTTRRRPWLSPRSGSEIGYCHACNIDFYLAPELADDPVCTTCNSRAVEVLTEDSDPRLPQGLVPLSSLLNGTSYTDSRSSRPEHGDASTEDTRRRNTSIRIQPPSILPGLRAIFGGQISRTTNDDAYSETTESEISHGDDARRATTPMPHIFDDLTSLINSPMTRSTTGHGTRAHTHSSAFNASVDDDHDDDDDDDDDDEEDSEFLSRIRPQRPESDARNQSRTQNNREHHRQPEAHRGSESRNRTHSFETHIHLAGPLVVTRSFFSDDEANTNDQRLHPFHIFHGNPPLRPVQATLDNTDETANLGFASLLPALFPMRELLNMLFGSSEARAVSGDAVSTQEAFDRIITQLMEAENRAQGIRPTAEAALEKLERQKVDAAFVEKHKKSLECTICLESMQVGNDIIFMPCKHWFHEECLCSWLKEHNTCPMCRTALEAAPVTLPRPFQSQPMSPGESANPREEGSASNTRNADNTDANETTTAQDSANRITSRIYLPLLRTRIEFSRSQSHRDSIDESPTTTTQPRTSLGNDERSSGRQSPPPVETPHSAEESIYAFMRSFQAQRQAMSAALAANHNTNNSDNNNSNGQLPNESAAQRAARLHRILQPGGQRTTRAWETAFGDSGESETRPETHSETEGQPPARVHTFSTQASSLSTGHPNAVSLMGQLLGGSSETGSGFGAHLFVVPGPRQSSTGDQANDTSETTTTNDAADTTTERAQNDIQWATLSMEAAETRQRDRERQRERQRRLDSSNDRERTSIRREAPSALPATLATFLGFTVGDGRWSLHDHGQSSDRHTRSAGSQRTAEPQTPQEQGQHQSPLRSSGHESRWDWFRRLRGRRSSRGGNNGDGDNR